MFVIAGIGGEADSLSDFNDPRKTVNRQLLVAAALIHLRKPAERFGFARRISQTAEVGRRIVEAGFRVPILIPLEEGPAQLSPGRRQPFLMPRLLVEVDRFSEKSNRLFQMSCRVFQ